MKSDGIYEIDEAAYLLGVTRETIARIALPDAAGRPGIVPPSLGWAFTFRDLVALWVVVNVRRSGTTFDEIRRGLDILRAEFHVDQPFAHQRVLESLGSSGRSFLFESPDGWADLGRSGQLAMAPAVELYLVRFDYDEERLARRWHPHASVLLDPAIQVGAPCVEGHRIETRVLAGLAQEGASVEEIAEMYELAASTVEDALQFESDLERHGLLISPSAFVGA